MNRDVVISFHCLLNFGRLMDLSDPDHKKENAFTIVARILSPRYADTFLGPPKWHVETETANEDSNVPFAFASKCRCCVLMKTYNRNQLPQGWETRPFIEKGYRVNIGIRGSFRSIFAYHNETWNIWTDIIPTIVVLALFVNHFLTMTSCSFARSILEAGVFAGIFISRLFSGLFHILNSTSLWANNNLLNVDLLGICSMAFVSPYFFVFWLKVDPEEAFDDTRFKLYCGVLYCMFGVCCVVFISNLTWGATRLRQNLEQVILVALAVIGNFVSVLITFDASIAWEIRVMCTAGYTSFLVGYVMFFIGNLPEALMENGVSDCKWWNSHVIWHVLATIGQFNYLMILVIYSPLSHN